MQDKSGAHAVAPDGSRLGIMPTTSGGVATLPRAPDQDVPRAVAARAPGSPIGPPVARAEARRGMTWAGPGPVAPSAKGAGSGRTLGQAGPGAGF